jgi:hypothetical protein
MTEQEQPKKKRRANLDECINRLHERVKAIESKFNINLSEEDKDLFNDLKRDIIIPLEEKRNHSQEIQTSKEDKLPISDTSTIQRTGEISVEGMKFGEDKTPDIFSKEEQIRKELHKDYALPKQDAEVKS